MKVVSFLSITSLSRSLLRLHGENKQQQQGENGENFLELGYIDASFQREGTNHANTIEYDAPIVSSSAQLERDRDADLNDDIRAVPHSETGTETNTQSDYNHVDVHIDTTDEGEVPLQNPSKEDEEINEGVLDQLRANI